MPFPPAQRVFYNRNPLERVICQLRFPPILRIDANIPAEFQEQVRTKFPNFNENAEFRIELPQGSRLPAELVQQAVQATGMKNYEFSSDDGFWKINLTRTFVALTATNYRRWEEFREQLLIPLVAFTRIYEPAYFSRLGLRYINLIRRSSLGLEDAPWRDLLSSHVIGMLGTAETADSVIGLECTQQIRLAEDGGTARVMSKLVKANDSEELCFMVDSDLFNTVRTEFGNVEVVLNFLNTRSSRLMRWSITNRSHEAMEPQTL
jgi:uncharacterized protein (TIGR04255 family)